MVTNVLNRSMQLHYYKVHSEGKASPLGIKVYVVTIAPKRQDINLYLGSIYSSFFTLRSPKNMSGEKESQNFSLQNIIASIKKNNTRNVLCFANQLQFYIPCERYTI